MVLGKKNEEKNVNGTRPSPFMADAIKNFHFLGTLPGKSMCISEVHGGAGLGCGPASAHYIAEQVLGYGFLRWFKNILCHATLSTYPKVCQLLLLSLGLFIK